MKARQTHLLQSLRAAHLFIVDHADELGLVPHNSTHRRLCEALEHAVAYANAQCTAQLCAQSATRVLHARRTALLRDHLAPLVAIATEHDVTPAEPQAFRMPRRWAREEQLRGYAVGIAEAARPFTQQFVQYGLPADFADRMIAAAQSFIDAANQRRTQRMLGFHATRGLAEQLRQGRKTVQVLNAMVRTATHDNPTLFEAWCAAIKPQAVAVRSRQAVETVGTPQVALATEFVAAPMLVSVEEPVPAEATRGFLRLLRGPVRKRDGLGVAA